MLGAVLGVSLYGWFHRPSGEAGHVWVLFAVFLVTVVSGFYSIATASAKVLAGGFLLNVAGAIAAWLLVPNAEPLQTIEYVVTYFAVVSIWFYTHRLRRVPR